MNKGSARKSAKFVKAKPKIKQRTKVKSLMTKKQNKNGSRRVAGSAAALRAKSASKAGTTRRSAKHPTRRK